MGGRIGVESMVGQGSTFWVELTLTTPVAALTAAGGSPVDDGKPVTAAPGADRTVLYIEDNLSNLRLVEQILRHRPAITLVAAMQGGLGFELACEHQPALILLDLHLPDLPGQEVLRRLRAEPRTQAIPVVVLSADATPGHVESLRAAGADAYLTKPLDVQQFLGVLDELIGKAAAHAG